MKGFIIAVIIIATTPIMRMILSLDFATFITFTLFYIDIILQTIATGWLAYLTYRIGKIFIEFNF